MSCTYLYLYIIVHVLHCCAFCSENQRKTINKPKSRRASGSLTSPTTSEASFNSATDIRNYIYKEWSEKKYASAKKNISEKKRLEKEEQLKKEKVMHVHNRLKI